MPYNVHNFKQKYFAARCGALDYIIRVLVQYRTF